MTFLALVEVTDESVSVGGPGFQHTETIGHFTKRDRANDAAAKAAEAMEVGAYSKATPIVMEVPPLTQ